MANCENLEFCPFFQDRMEKKSVLTYVYKQRFCNGDASECARYVAIKYLGKGNFPTDLYPNEMARVRKLIANAKTKKVEMAAVCECFSYCGLFNSGVARLPSTSKSFQEKFCTLNHFSCARYMVYKQLGKDLIPGDLFPNERGRALKLIEAA